MTNYRVTINRTYTTHVEVNANSEEEALEMLNDMDIYEMELEQMNTTEEITITPKTN